MMIKQKLYLANCVVSGLAVLAIIYSTILVGNVAVINFTPLPDDVYRGTNLIKQNSALATQGNFLVYGGNSYPSKETAFINYTGKPDSIRIVVTDRLKPITYKRSTNEGFSIDLTNDDNSSLPVSAAPKQVDNKQAPKLLAKGILFTRQVSGDKVSWATEVMELFENTPMPQSFSSTFLISEGNSGTQEPKKVIFQNDIIFFIENPEYVFPGVSSSMPSAPTQNQQTSQDVILPDLLIRTDENVKRVAEAKIMENFSFLSRIVPVKRTQNNGKVVITIQKESAKLTPADTADATPTTNATAATPGATASPADTPTKK